MFNRLKKIFKKENASVIIEDYKAKEELNNLIFRAQQSTLALLQKHLEDNTLEARLVVAAIVMSMGGEYILDHKFIELIREENLNLFVENLEDNKNATRYTLRKATEKSNIEEIKSEQC